MNYEILWLSLPEHIMKILHEKCFGDAWKFICNMRRFLISSHTCYLMVNQTLQTSHFFI